jgi:hypothetical protein
MRFLNKVSPESLYEFRCSYNEITKIENLSETKFGHTIFIYCLNRIQITCNENKLEYLKDA